MTLHAYGSLTPGQAGRSVTVTFSAPGQPATNATVTTNVDGGWSASALAPPGTWGMTASFAGDAAAGAASAAAGCE
jgi:hypothetical protein